MISSLVSRLVILVFGTLYPAYASYKAVKTKNVREYVKWMMYWIVFAFFTCTETLTDILFSFWFPFYYEIKIILVVWLLSPATKGSSILYRKFVHPQLHKREKDIDEYINRAKEQGYNTVLQIGMGGLNYASQFVLQTALKGGGQFFADHLRRSYSLGDLSEGPQQVQRLQGADIHTISEERQIYDSVDAHGQAVPHVYDLDSESDTGDLLTHSSGYGSGDLVVRAPPVKEASRSPIRRRTRSSQKTTENTTHKAASSDTVAYATLPRASRKTSRKRNLQ